MSGVPAPRAPSMSPPAHTLEVFLYSAAPDRILLTWFVRQGDKRAFEELFRRHGSMVRGVCRRTVGNDADAEDALQGTFLVLARRAGEVEGESLPKWLCGVARKLAKKLRSMNARWYARAKIGAR